MLMCASCVGEGGGGVAGLRAGVGELVDASHHVRDNSLAVPPLKRRVGSHPAHQVLDLLRHASAAL